VAGAGSARRRVSARRYSAAAKARLAAGVVVQQVVRGRRGASVMQKRGQHSIHNGRVTSIRRGAAAAGAGNESELPSGIRISTDHQTIHPTHLTRRGRQAVAVARQQGERQVVVQACWRRRCAVRSVQAVRHSERGRCAHPAGRQVAGGGGGGAVQQAVCRQWLTSSPTRPRHSSHRSMRRRSGAGAGVVWRAVRCGGVCHTVAACVVVRWLAQAHRTNIWEHEYSPTPDNAHHRLPR